MGILIDASVLIAAERGTLEIDQLLAAHGSEEAALSAITAAEILHGVHRAPLGKLRTRREAFVERLLEQLPVLPFDLVTRASTQGCGPSSPRGASPSPSGQSS